MKLKRFKYFLKENNNSNDNLKKSSSSMNKFGIPISIGNWVVAYGDIGEDITIKSANTEKEALEIVFEYFNIKTKEELSKYIDEDGYDKNNEKFLIYSEIGEGGNIYFGSSMSLNKGNIKGVKTEIYYKIEYSSDYVDVLFSFNELEDVEHLGDGYEIEKGKLVYDFLNEDNNIIKSVSSMNKFGIQSDLGNWVYIKETRNGYNVESFTTEKSALNRMDNRYYFPYDDMKVNDYLYINEHDQYAQYIAKIGHNTNISLDYRNMHEINFNNKIFKTFYYCIFEDFSYTSSREYIIFSTTEKYLIDLNRYNNDYDKEIHILEFNF